MLPMMVMRTTTTTMTMIVVESSSGLDGSCESTRVLRLLHGMQKTKGGGGHNIVSSANSSNIFRKLYGRIHLGRATAICKRPSAAQVYSSKRPSAARVTSEIDAHTYSDAHTHTRATAWSRCRDREHVMLNGWHVCYTRAAIDIYNRLECCIHVVFWGYLGASAGGASSSSLKKSSSRRSRSLRTRIGTLRGCAPSNASTVPAVCSVPGGCQCVARACGVCVRARE